VAQLNHAYRRGEAMAALDKLVADYERQIRGMNEDYATLEKDRDSWKHVAEAVGANATLEDNKMLDCYTVRFSIAKLLLAQSKTPETLLQYHLGKIYQQFLAKLPVRSL
jgi:hypothetical protein